MEIGGSASDLAEIEAMIRVSGLSARALGLRAGLSDNTVKKAIAKLREGGKVYASTMAKLRAAMRDLGYKSWTEGVDEVLLEAAMLATIRVIGSITQLNAGEAAAIAKETYDTLIRQPELSDEQIQVAANNFANGVRRRRGG